ASAAGAPPIPISRSVAEKGQPEVAGAAASGIPLLAAATGACAPSVTAGAAATAASPLSVPRVISSGAGGTVRPPRLTPSEETNWVSPGLVTIEKRAPHDSQRKVIPRRPSSGASTFWNAMYFSQFKQTNFIGSPQLRAEHPAIFDQR